MSRFVKSLRILGHESGVIASNALAPHRGRTTYFSLEDKGK